MKTLIVYASKYGTTKKCAEKLAEKLAEALVETTLYSCDGKNTISLKGYERVILGSSVYIGRPRKNFKKFIQNNNHVLLDKKIALFICSKETEDYNTIFSQEIAYLAEYKAHFGYELHISKMNGLDKFVTKKMTGALVDVSEIKSQAVDSFIKILLK